ncbi:RNA pseudouridylate synthase domain-containing protein 1-like [Prorops nasuta]|uniref:RNA pseudouridylate synthase domain-containing protein 1-like n=1 Tax=Prorops nasuta TaxID=863751 RepID=UPI0034CD6625
MSILSYNLGYNLYSFISATLQAMLVWFLNYYKKYFITTENCNFVRILYQSTNFLVVEKPYDMVINCNNADRKYTLQFKLREMFPELVNPKLCHEFYFVHRLDYATSGVMCIALNKRAAQAASTVFQNRKASKYYLALVHGHINGTEIIIDKDIGNDIREKEGNHKMCTSDSIFCEKPKKSCTILLVLEYGIQNGKLATKVLLCPMTGRRHQLRVHCYYIGHPIIGDYTYSKGKDIEPHRTFLHSFRLVLNNDMENLDIRTTDPFSDLDSKNQWTPLKTLRILDENIFLEANKLIT